MERKIGEIFTYNGKMYQVVKSDICENCAFRENDCSILRSRIGLCVSSTRFDKTNVVFKEINNMEIKNNQLTIDIPEGMEIDTENSSLAEGIIKFKSKYITYSKIINSFNSITNTNVYIHSSDTKALKAIAQLMNIAKYYNGDWNYNANSDECGYMIAYDKTTTEICGYQVININADTDMYFGNVMFKNEADAQYVIDNPNFRAILNAIYKN
nr:MAG: hypothetical protein [Bacteriophage sp.]